VNETIQTYDRIAGAFAERNFDVRLHGAHEEFARAIVGNAPANRFRILDAGCGPGRDSKWFRERGFQTIGVDLSAGMLAEARRRVPDVDFRQADLRSLDLPDGYFDGIWCSAALLHLPRPDVLPVLRSFNRLLGHGYLWLAVKGGQGEAILDGDYGPNTPRAFTYFSRFELELYLERAGFDVYHVVDGQRTDARGHPWLEVLSQTKLDSPLVGAAAVIFDASGRVLLSERADGRGWNLPSGFVDASESPDEAIVREVREETGLEVEVVCFLGVGTSPRAKRAVGPAVHGNIVSHAFLCRAIGGELTYTTEALRHGWFASDALPAPMAARRHVDLIASAIAAREGRLVWPVVKRYGPPSSR
jgi:ADP-ribose pyrophosphatase YjhB (NUDIX family)